MKTLIFASCFLILTTFSFAQVKLDVSGDALIEGTIRTAPNGDITSVFLGTLAGVADDGTGNSNVFIGFGAGNDNTTGFGNTFVGRESGAFNTTSSENTFIGYRAGRVNTGGSRNTFLGHDAGSENTTGNKNTFLGNDAGSKNTTGRQNTFEGHFAGLDNTTGNFNTFIGDASGFNNEDGEDNTFLGFGAGANNKSGDRNTYLGEGAGENNVTGGANTFVGSGAGSSNISNNNTLIGFGAGGASTTAHSNTYVGRNAGGFNTSGDRNTFVGMNAGQFSGGSDLTAFGQGASASSANLSNSIMLGSQSTATASHQAVLGNTATQSIRGSVGWSTVSDGRFKQAVEENVPGLDFINQLRPVTYRLDPHALARATGERRNGDEEADKEQLSAFRQYREEKSKVRYTGFVAQEVEAAAQKVGFDFSGIDKPRGSKDIYALRYAEFVVPLVKGIQEQQKEIEKQQKDIEKQQKEIDALQARNEELGEENSYLKDSNARLQKKVSDLDARLTKLEALTTDQPSENFSDHTQVAINGDRRPHLYQNAPNPFNHSTTIGYFIPQKINKAELHLSDLSGKVVQIITISTRGEGRMVLDTTKLSGGTYQYSLLLDGKLLDTKQMVLSRY